MDWNNARLVCLYSADRLGLEVKKMAIKIGNPCSQCGRIALADHRGESSADGAQHYDLLCPDGHQTQMHLLVSGPPPFPDDIAPTDCPPGCQFHVR